MSIALRDTLLVARSANLDFVVRAAHVPALGGTMLGREFAAFPGGKGAFQRADGRHSPPRPWSARRLLRACVTLDPDTRTCTGHR